MEVRCWVICSRSWENQSKSATTILYTAVELARFSYYSIEIELYLAFRMGVVKSTSQMRKF